MEVALFLSIRRQSERSERVQKAQVVAQAQVACVQKAQVVAQAQVACVQKAQVVALASLAQLLVLFNTVRD